MKISRYQRHIVVFACLGLFVVLIALALTPQHKTLQQTQSSVDQTSQQYWFLLERRSNKEYLYRGTPGNKSRSQLMKTFDVKVGIPGQRPTPLPRLIGREYWKVIEKEPSDNPDTGPYFLTLDIPTSGEWPYGPVPYEECGEQCDWVTTGYFGLHGVAGNPQKLSNTDPGSSGCVRHADEDITYLYNLLDPEKSEVRYYVQDA